eukprot:CAMPEP_0202365272 /NCGR_PEP_ID=MMETSP1126-20121109/16336_1 /ASSEMBLY_ACC=CAM_ASM_000457 /TAXON_ID=3047 /ORGANISM="Dunaliella tertiolecta, Strain CCMP1320" /LENGTH=87 /DNA_ID=CAMNT_0048960061 /DNA_START=95 /DNA_END=359 /DNA_ORIENTATION=+
MSSMQWCSSSFWKGLVAMAMGGLSKRDLCQRLEQQLRAVQDVEAGAQEAGLFWAAPPKNLPMAFLGSLSRCGSCAVGHSSQAAPTRS